LARETTADVHAVWRLTSTSGRAALTCSVQGDITADSVIHEVSIEYALSGRETSPATARVADLEVAVDRLRVLNTELRRWSDKAMEDPAREPIEHRFELAQRRDQSLALGFGPRNDLVIGPGQLGCRVELRTSSFETRVVFVTDPTCLGALSEDLAVVLRPQ
jgi:hypothetical protein